MSSCTVLVTVTVTVFCFLHIALAQYPKAPVGYAEEVFHRHSISTYRNPNRNYPRLEDNRRNSKSMSFIDYFFPSSRTAKVSNVFDNPKTNASDKTTTNAASTMIEKLSSLASVVVEQTTDPIPYSTREEGRATGSTKKGTSTTKRKTSSVHQPSTTPKTKNTQKTSSQSTSYQTSLKNVQRATTPKPTDKNTSPNKTPTASSASSQKTTHKHYTIYPSVITSKTNPPTSIYKSKQPESTTAKIASASSVQSSTAQKVTVAELGKVTTTPTEKTTSSAGTSPAESAATDLDGREGEYELKDKQTQTNNVKLNEQTKKETVPLPAGSTSVLAKPTKYHYYPHNQHIYLLPECAIQQVCNAVYVRLNYTQPLCACPARHRDPCSASLNADDLHTTQLTTDSKKKYAHKAVTLVKTCEATSEMRECRAPRDWSLLALQNVRTGKSHYLVICRCPQEFILEGPMSHDQPTYASVPGIRVYGMMCVQPQNQFSTTGYNSVTSRPSTSSYKIGYSQPQYNQDQSTSRFPGYIGPGVYYNRMARRIRDTSRMSKKFNHVNVPPFPWEKAKELALTADWEN